MEKKNKKSGSKRLTTKRNKSIIPVVRTAIIKRMKEKKWSAYRLCKAVEGKMTPQTVYDYIAEPPRTKINDGFVGHILEALDLEIRPKN